MDFRFKASFAQSICVKDASFFVCIINNSGVVRIDSNHQSLMLSPYVAFYDIVVPQDNMLCQINDSVALNQRNIVVSNLPKKVDTS